jgi:serine/threonine-protein kinase
MKLCPQCKTEYPGGEVFCPLDGARLSSPSELHGEQGPPVDPLIGSTLAERYRVIRRIGEGGMGLVYEAEHAVIEKRVAIKVLRDDFSSRPEVVERFELEAKSASRIGHEHIVDISDFGLTPSGSSYFVMEFLEGEDLANILAREGTLSAPRAVHILTQCCRALGAAHAKGIVHRDIKPENVFLTHRGDNPDFVKIVDFGIAKMSDLETEGAPGRKLTKTGMIFGTPEYMSPEQAAGKSLDHRVDTYALGVILYECIVGRVPFVGDTFMGVLTQHMFEDPPPLRTVNPTVNVSPEIEEVIYMALSKSPDERFQSMADLEAAMAAALDPNGRKGTLVGYGDPVKTRAKARRAAGDPHRSTKGAETLAAPKMWAFVALGLVSLVLGGLGAWALTRGSMPEPTDEANAAAAQPTDLTEALPAQGPEPTVTPETIKPTEAAPVEPDAEPTPELVAMTIETRPTGASVSVEGQDLACEPSPCMIELPVGQVAVLRAVRGRAVGELEVNPTEASTVEIALRARRRGRATENSATPPSTMRSGDLKIPDIFR